MEEERDEKMDEGPWAEEGEYDDDKGEATPWSEERVDEMETGSAGRVGGVVDGKIGGTHAFWEYESIV